MELVPHVCSDSLEDNPCKKLCLGNIISVDMGKKSCSSTDCADITVLAYLKPGLCPAHRFCLDLQIANCSCTSHFCNAVMHLLQKRKTSIF